MKKVVVTKGIFPPQPLHHSRKNNNKKKTSCKNAFFQIVSLDDLNVGQRQDLPQFWEMHKYGFPFQRVRENDPGTSKTTTNDDLDWV